MKIYINKSRLVLLTLILLSFSLLYSCSKDNNNEIDESFETWQEVEDAGMNKTVTILMWGGNDMINTYMDEIVAKKLKDQYGITLNRVPMNAPEYLNKLINEKNGNQTIGNADILWINAENFRTAQQGGLLWGPFTDLLPNNLNFNDLNSSDLITDTGIPINGMEAIWGRAQLVLTTDGNRVSNPPKSYAELLAWAKENPGRFTYPQLPDDFVGSAFVRGAMYEILGLDDFTKTYTEEEFNKLISPVMDYFESLHPYLWQEGTAFPTSQAQLDELFLNNEVDFTMGFEVGKTAGQVITGAYPIAAYSYVFETGTIGNAHYLAIPFNSPEKAAAMLTIDLLQSPEMQLEKFDSTVWGDLPGLDTKKLSNDDRVEFLELTEKIFSTLLSDLYDSRLPDLKAQYIDWVEYNWVQRFAK